MITERHAFALLASVLIFIAGALLGGAVNALVERYAVFKESKGVALAVQAEMNAVLRLVEFRQYLPGMDAIIVRLRDPTHVVDLSDLFLIRAEEDYFSVFHAVAPKIGLLAPFSGDVVLVYAAAKSLLEDMKFLRDEGQSYLEGRRQHVPPDQIRAFLLYQTTQINGLLRQAVTLATQSVANLNAFANKRWFWVFS